MAGNNYEKLNFTLVQNLRKKIAELKESEKKFRTLFDSSADAIMTLAPPDWKFTSGNPATIKMFMANDEADFISKGPWEVSPKKQPDGQLSSVKAKKMIGNAMEKGSNFFEWTHRRLNGDDFPATVLLTRMEIAGKSLLQATVRDITEKKKVEEEIRQSEALLRNVIDSSPDLIFVKDRELRGLVCNKAYASAVGKNPDGMKGKTDIENGWKPELVRGNPSKGIRGFENDDKAALKGRFIHNPYDLANVGGEVRVFDTYKLPLYDNKHKIIGVLGLARDVTQLKKAEDALKESEENFRAIFESSGDGILAADVNSGKFMFANPAICRLTGYSTGELLKLSVNRLHPKKDLAYVLNCFKKQARSEIDVAKDIPVLRKDGKVVYCDINSTVTRINGENIAVGFFRDITERKKTEDDILYKAALLESQFETSIDGILVVDSKGRKVSHNMQFARIWNMPDNLLNTKDDSRMIGFVLDQLKDPESFVSKVKYLYSHKNEESRDRIRLKDGRVFDRYSSPLYDKNGKYHGRIWYFRVIQ